MYTSTMQYTIIDEGLKGGHVLQKAEEASRLR
jgi:hypothetical protein